MSNGLDSFSDRLNIIKSHFNYTNSDLAKVCGVSHTAVQKILSGTIKDVKANLLSNLETKLFLNIGWLMYGEGEMFKEGANSNNNNILTSYNSKNEGNITQNQGTYNSNSKNRDRDKGRDNSTSDTSKDVIIESLKNEKSSLEKENEFLKKQLEFVNSLLDKAISK